MSAVSCILNHIDFIMCSETARFLFSSKIEILGHFSLPVYTCVHLWYIKVYLKFFCLCLSKRLENEYEESTNNP